MISFNRPLFLFLTLLVPFYFFLRKTGLLRQIEFPLTLGDWNGLPFKWTSHVMRGSSLFSALFAGAGFVCVVLALSQPVRFSQEPVYSSSGTGIIFALDVSPSMAARDLGEGTRLDIARSFIHSFIEKRPGDSFGLVGIGSEAALLVPPTADQDVFISRLDSLSIGELGDGSAIGLGLAVSAAHLIHRRSGRSCVVLLTDGENNAGEINPKTAAVVFAENNISLFIAGIGSKGEVSIDYTDPLTGKRYSGTLDSEYSDGELQSIAERGGGTFVSAVSAGALESIFLEIGESLPVQNSTYSRTIEEPLERPLIFTALVLFALVWFIRRVIMGAVL